MRLAGLSLRNLRRRPLAAAGLAAACAGLVYLGVTAPNARGTYDAAAATEVRNLRQQLDDCLATIETEARALRQAGDAAGAASLESRAWDLRRRADNMSLSPDDEPELHVVSVWEGLPGNITAPATSPRQGVTAVEVSATHRPIVLGLCAHEPQKWELTVRPGVRLARVILRGRGPHDVTGVPRGVPVQRVTFKPKPETPPPSPDPLALAAVEPAMQKLTGMTVCTLQSTYQPASYVIGPANRPWEFQRVLADARQVQLRALRSRWDRARAALGHLRFTGVWTPPPVVDVTSRSVVPDCVAQFDLQGPIRRTMDPLPPQISNVVDDSKTHSRYGLWSSVFMRIDAQPHVPGAPTARAPTAREPTAVDAMAFDSRRRRFLLIAWSGPARYASAFTFYRPDDDTISSAGTGGAGIRYDALTFSESDDCFYALSHAVVDGATVTMIVRIDADGSIPWRIPLCEHVRSSDFGAAGPYLAVLTPPLPDPLDANAPPRPRCVLIDANTNTILYAGPMAVHDAAAPATAETLHP